VQAPNGRLFRALTEYLAAYHEVLDSAVPNPDPEARRAVKAAQDAYDVYSEKRDPATGLFKSYFGAEVSAQRGTTA
jgi:15,16-dihydrobiliverdin:ferredoxin oxidoreductase